MGKNNHSKVKKLNVLAFLIPIYKTLSSLAKPLIANILYCLSKCMRDIPLRIRLGCEGKNNI